MSVDKKITKEEILRVAHLARLELSPEEVEKFYSQLGSILEYVSQLHEVKEALDKVSPTSQVAGLKNVVRSDVLSEREKEEREILLQDAPHRSGDYFKVKKVIE